MIILKSKNNYRYYFKEDFLYIANENMKFRLKMNINQYERFCNLINMLNKGVTLSYADDNLNNYSGLIQLLKKYGVVYEIPEELLQYSKDKMYFSIVEGFSSDIPQTLSTLTTAHMLINDKFIALKQLEKILRDNNLQYSVTDEIDNDLEIQFNDGTKEFINTLKTKSGDIMITPTLIKDINYLYKDRLIIEDISPKILAQFVFYNIIESAASNGVRENFTINKDLEVKRKKVYTSYESNHKKSGKECKVNKQTKIEYPLNSLEMFIRNVNSKVISFNNNLEYGWYKQAPIQVFTIQHYDIEDKFKSCYFADISYERLCNFISEVGFMNILKKSYGKDYMITSNGECVSDTVLNSVSNKAEIFNLEELHDHDAIKDLLAQTKLDITLYKQCIDYNKYLIYILNKDNGVLYRFGIPLNDVKYVDLVIYTYVSSIQNKVDLSEAFFIELEDYKIEPHTRDIDFVAFTTSGSSEIVWKESNLNMLLKDYDFKYEIKEMMI